MTRTKNRQISTRVTDEDYQAILARQNASKMTQNRFITHCLINHPINVLEGLPGVILELKRIGNNLNQLTRSVNAGKVDCQTEVNALAEEVREVWRSLKQLKEGHL
jgi:hypothetical protein